MTVGKRDRQGSALYRGVGRSLQNTILLISQEGNQIYILQEWCFRQVFQLVLGQYIDIPIYWSSYLLSTYRYSSLVHRQITILRLWRHAHVRFSNLNIIPLRNLPYSKRCSAKFPLRAGLIRTAEMHKYLISLCSLYKPHPLTAVLCYSAVTWSKYATDRFLPQTARRKLFVVSVRSCHFGNPIYRYIITMDSTIINMQNFNIVQVIPVISRANNR